MQGWDWGEGGPSLTKGLWLRCYSLFYFRCVENCKEKMIASQRLVLRGDCLTSCIGTLFEWKIWIHGENAFMPGIENLITTPVNGSMFVLKPDIFKEKTNYTVVQTASRESGAQQVFDYLVVVDEVPKGGNV